MSHQSNDCQRHVQLLLQIIVNLAAAPDTYRLPLVCKDSQNLSLQDRARALSELRRLEADIGEAMRNLKGAQGDEEALRNKAMHLRDEIDRAEIARDKAVATHERAAAVSPAVPQHANALL